MEVARLRQGFGGRVRRGLAALTATFLIGVTLIIVASSLAFILTTEVRETGFRNKEAQALYLAEAGIERAIVFIQATVEARYLASHDTAAVLTWLESLVGTEILSGNLETGSYRVQAAASRIENVLQRHLTLSSVGTARGVSKTVRQEVAFGFQTASVFDYAYFINNFGWLYGGAQRFQGDVRANGNFSVRGNQRINGDVYASGIIDRSRGNITYDTLDNYFASATTRARPGDPAAPDGASNPGGYDAFADLYDASGNPRHASTPQLHPNERVVDMPYLGNLSYYQNLAQQRNGTISQGGVVVVNNTYNGNLILNGTAADPIVINGPVVVSNDVIIKGVVSGQGTIYAGRNVHVIGNLTYSNPPSWPKPDADPQGTASANESTDLLALSAKGNVVFGDYNSSAWIYVRNYLRPPFTRAYEVDPTDASIGYVSYYQNGNPYFNGNYTNIDGGTKTDGSSRRYYESSLANSQWAALSPTNYISQIDAIIYDNHAVAGRTYNFTLNGSIVARDEAIVFQGNLLFNYDYRVKQSGAEYIDITLPISVADPERTRWSD